MVLTGRRVFFPPVDYWIKRDAVVIENDDSVSLDYEQFNSDFFSPVLGLK